MIKIESSVNHYKIIEKIGEGGMGEVYLAHDSKLNRHVALKFLSEVLGRSEKFRHRFVKEAQSAAKLNHPNIVTVHEVGDFEKRPYIAMAYVKGETLEKLKEERQLTIPEIINIGCQIAAGLVAAHSNGITHRDLKPANIILDDKRKVHILDFGLALSSDASDVENTLTKLTDIGAVVGTVPYMSPEQLRGEPVNHLTDIFALGAILYELAAGNRPFGGNSSAEITSSILRDTPKTISDIRPDIPYDLQRIINRCLQKESSKRFQTALDILNELEELKTGNSINILAAQPVSGRSIKSESVSEGTFILTADLVRKLENRSPLLIGGKMAFAKNDERSDTLMIILHSLSLEHRHYLGILGKIPCHCVAPTLFGWDAGAAYRPTLSVSDHSTILRGMIQHFSKEFGTKKLILAAFGSGAEQFIHMLISPEGAGAKVDGTLLMRCNIDSTSVFVTRMFSEMKSNTEADILNTMSMAGSRVTSLVDWARHQTYMAALINRFGTNIEPISRYSSDIVKPLIEHEETVFADRYKTIVSKVPLVRFVFDRDEFGALDRLLHKHLENNILGDDYSPHTIHRANMTHVELGQPESMLEQARSFLKEFEQRSH